VDSNRRYAPAYYEDADLAFSVRAVGRKVYYQPAAKVVHFEGQTSGTDLASGVKRHQELNRHTSSKNGRTCWPATATTACVGARARSLSAARVLVIEACMLTPDQDAGSVRMQAMLELAVESGSRVSFVADNLEHRQPYVSALQGARRRGAVPSLREVDSRTARGARARIRHRHRRPPLHRGEAPRRHPPIRPQALVAFDTVDLHFLRSERLAELDGGAAAKAAARASARRNSA